MSIIEYDLYTGIVYVLHNKCDCLGAAQMNHMESLSFYVDVFSPKSLPILSPDVHVYMSSRMGILSETGLLTKEMVPQDLSSDFPFAYLV